MHPRPATTRKIVLSFYWIFTSMLSTAQNTPRNASQPWSPSTGEIERLRSAVHSINTNVDLKHEYTLFELIDLAEKHNPETRAAWQRTKEKAGELRIAESDLLPVVIAKAEAATMRQGVLLYSEFARQTLGYFQPLLEVNYTIFDFGRRGSRIEAARQQLAAVDYIFNTAQLNLLYETRKRYYRLLNAQGQLDAARVAAANAHTVRDAVDARLAVGLATLPDFLEARAAAAQADFDLVASKGQVDITRGDLQIFLGISPISDLLVQPLDELQIPERMDETAEAAIERSLAQRPELSEEIAGKLSAAADVQGARSNFLPSLNFSGSGGEIRAYGQQNQLPNSYAGPVEVWDVKLGLRWTLFDGGRREAELTRNKAVEHRADAEITATHDEIEQQVWTAYVDLRTAFQQRQTAMSLLQSAQSSYDAALKSYKAGVRNVVDVVTSQRVLAQAQSEDVTARTAVLTQLATMAWRTGDLLQTRPPARKP